MKRRMAWISGVTLAAAATMVACNKPASPSADLSRDLDAASSTTSSLTLAPTSGSRDVVSAMEQSPEARHAVAPATKQPIARQPQIVPPPVEVAPQAVTPSVAVAAVPTATTPATINASQSPRPTPAQPAHKGRYKTEAEVIRGAPFPINP